MKAHFFLPSVDGDLTEGKPPINVKFEIPYFTTSGIQVSGGDRAVYGNGKNHITPRECPN